MVAVSVAVQSRVRSYTYRGELAAALIDRLRGAAHEHARGDACEDAADGTDGAREASGEANHREDGAVAHRHARRALSNSRRRDACAEVRWA